MIDTKADTEGAAVLDELETRRSELVKWHNDEVEYSREGMAARQARQELEDEIAKLIRSNPLLIDGDDQPVSKDNPVAKLRAALEKAPDPDAIFRRRDHARAVVAKLTQDFEAFLLENFEAVHAARYPEAVEVREAVMRHRDGYLAATQAYLDFAKETIALTGPHPEYNGQNVAGLDEGAELARVLERVADLPLPTVNGQGPGLEPVAQPVFFEHPEVEGDQ